MNRRRTVLLASVGLWLSAAGLSPVPLSSGLIAPPAAQAQNIGQRVVEGKVIDDSSAAVDGATIFLRNLKTKSIRSYTSSDGGRFRFTQVNKAEDYDLWAEKDGKKSATKSVSSWDSRADFECELRLK